MPVSALRLAAQSYLEMEFCGRALLPNRDGSLFIPDEKILVVSDLHLEKGSSFARQRKVFLPPYDTRETLERLRRCIELFSPRMVISLGDSFHDDNGAERIPACSSEVLKDLINGKDWVWITGNHDPAPPKYLPGDVFDTFTIAGLNFRHEPQIDHVVGEIAGHLHPCAKIRRRGKSVRRPCFAENGRRLIMPAFGAYTGGLNLLDPAYDGILSFPGTNAWMLGGDCVYKIQGNLLVP